MLTSSAAINPKATVGPHRERSCCHAINPSGPDKIVTSFLCLSRTRLCLGLGHKFQFQLQQRHGLRWRSSLFDLVSNWGKNALL